MLLCTTNDNELMKKISLFCSNYIPFEEFNIEWICIMQFKWICFEFKFLNSNELNILFFWIQRCYFSHWNLNWIEYKLVEFKLVSIDHFHSFIELNSTKSWKYNYEKAYVKLLFNIHVLGLVKGVK
jgi:hypothetical protein